MKRHNVEELKNLLARTTPGEWNEQKVATVFRSSSYRRGESHLMAQVKGDDGIAPSDHAKGNGVLMSMARNFAEELLNYKLHRYGQDDCSGCADRDAEIEKLKQRIGELEGELNTNRCMLQHKLRLQFDDSLGYIGGILAAIGTLQTDSALHSPKARELECKDCQQINFHEDCHAVQEKTAVRCAELAATFSDDYYPLGIQWRIAAAIKEEFGVEDGGICPVCSSDSTITTGTLDGVQGNGQEVGVTTYLCLPCRHIWSE